MKQKFFDPQIQEEQQATPIHGFQVQVGGVYVLLEDVVTAIREYAQSLDDASAGALVHDVASWLGAGGESVALAPIETPIERNEVPPAVMESPESELVSLGGGEVHGAESDDVTPDVARIEIFPDPPDDPRPKWYARSIDTGGFILKTTGGSYDFDWVVKNAEERWPDTPLHLLKNAGEDSKWIEDSTRGVFPSKGPPARRLWAGVTGA